MQGNPRVVELLNEILTAELTAINQYFLHARLCSNWGYDSLASKIRSESIEEMGHAESIIDRILYFDGHPNLQRLGTVGAGETVPEQFHLDLELEKVAIERLNEGIALCLEVGDNGTRELLDGILTSEEDHADWLETQLGLIDKLGETAYLAEQM